MPGRLNPGDPKPTQQIPALVFCEEHSGISVAALTLLDRLLVVLHRAACLPITVVCAGSVPDLRRSRAWRIPFNIVAQPPVISGPTLVATTSVLVEPSDIRRMAEQRSRLATADGTPLPIGVVSQSTDSRLEALDALPVLKAEGVAASVTDRRSARLAERALWASLTSSSDGFVDRHFNRPCGRPLAKLLIHTSVSPNAVSIASILLGVAAAFCFAAGSYLAAVIGAVFFQLSAIIDCVDGDIARAVFKESPLGKWLDLAGDQVVHVAVFAGIAIGLAQGGYSAPVLWLGLSAIIGALVSFVVVVRGLRRPASKNDGCLQNLLDTATNRDFSVLVFALVLLERLDLFLWLAAIGSHVFWLLLLALQLANSRSSPAAAGSPR